MPRPDYSRLRAQLIEFGVAPKYIRRTIIELEDHYDDLKNEALRHGYSCSSAERHATTTLGDVGMLAREVASRPELRSWAYRNPRVARYLLPAAYFALLPAVPIFIGVSHSSTIARWSASMMLGAAVTAGMFLALQLSIAVS